ncbi:MAG TPA: DUF881 domain-containing protein [Jiangellaceae bacterium]
MPAQPARRAEGRGWRIITPLVLVACGILLISSGKTVGGVFRGTGISDMPDLVRAEEERAERLSAEVSRLTAQVDELTSESAAENPAETERLETLRAAAGLTPVTGPGITVTLNDAPIPEDGTGDIDLDLYLVHQQDLEGVINALWAGGAEAMMVEDQRIVSTSSVKCIGPVLYLQQRVYAPPYTVAAIGDPNELLAALDESQAVQDYLYYVDQIGLGFTAELSEDILMPGYDGPRDISAETAA